MKNTDTVTMFVDGFQDSGECRLDERVWEGLEYLESVAGPGAIAEMIEHFRLDMPDRIQRMRGLLEVGDLSSLARLAHDLKSNSATLGVPALSELGFRVEQAAEQGDLEGVVSSIDAVERLFPRVFVALERRGSSFTS